MKKTLVLALLIFFSSNCTLSGEEDRVVKSFTNACRTLVANPVKDEIYFMTTDGNIVVVDSQTLEVVHEEYVAERAWALTVSNDGTRVYSNINDSVAPGIGVFDVVNRAVLPQISLPVAAADIVVSHDHKVYATASGSSNHDTYGIMVSDGSTGQYTGFFAADVAISGGQLAISDDGHTLLHQVVGYSPSRCYVFDMANSIPNLLQEFTPGSSGQDVIIANNQQFFCSVVVSNYGFWIRDMTDSSHLGFLDTGAYPRQLLFSRDDSLAYTVHVRNSRPIISVFELETFTLLKTIPTPGTQFALMALDKTGRYLFVADSDSVDVVDVGRRDYAEQVSTTRGQSLSGELAELSTRDDNYYSIRRSSTDINSRTEFTATTTSTIAEPSTLQIEVESNVLARTPVNQLVEIFNFRTNDWQLVDVRPASLTGDASATVDVTGDISRFVQESTLAMRARVRYESPVQRRRFVSNTDYFAWIIGF